MMKKLRMLAALVCCLTLLLACALGENSRVVVDDAELLTAEERQTLTDTINRIGDAYHFQIVLHTTRSTDGKSMRDYAADYYDYKGYGYGDRHNGLIFVVDMGSRQFVTVTTGTGITYFSDSDITDVEDSALSCLSDGEYAQAFEQYLSAAEDVVRRGYRAALSQGVTPEGDVYQVTTADRLQWAADDARDMLPMVLIVAAIITTIVMCVMVSHMKTARKKDAAQDYVEKQSLTRMADIYLYTTESRHKIETDDNNHSGGGGSHSTFTGSSGTSHGGGSARSF